MERFSDPRRTRRHQIAARAGMYRALHDSFIRSGVPWDKCYHEDRGDGVLILVPPDVPKGLLVSAWPNELATGLTEHNSAAEPEARIRLRVAVHAGEVCTDEHGVVGASVILTFRLLDAAVVKAALAASPGVVALIASNWYFTEVVWHDPACRPATYRHCQVSVKETDTIAWISLPDHPYPPITPIHSPGNREDGHRLLGQASLMLADAVRRR